MKKKILLIISIVAILLIFAYNYIYQDHRDISKETAEYTVTASNLVQDFINNTSSTQDKYLNKTLEVTGTITNQDANSVTLNNAVFCSLSTPTKVTLNSTITIKGRCIGFDDLLEEVKLDQSIIIK